MKRLSLITTILTFWFGVSYAQDIQCDLDSVNNTLLMTSQYMSYCEQGMRHSRNDERHSLSLGYYATPATSFYFIGLPIVTEQPQTVRKGNRLKVVMQPNDTITLRCSSDVMSLDRFYEVGKDSSWVVLPEYPCSEKLLRRIMDEKVQSLYQETADGKFVQIVGKDFHHWRFSKTINTIFKQLNKKKPENTDVDLLFRNGRVEYVSNDTVIATQKGLNFSEKWVY